MTINDYQSMAMRTAPENQRTWSNVGLGLAGEAGECADVIKKHLHQGHPLDRDKLFDELGDVAWYIALGCTALGVSMESVLEGNIAKLLRRYPEQFDPERSIHREDAAHGHSDRLHGEGAAHGECTGGKRNTEGAVELRERNATPEGGKAAHSDAERAREIE